MKIINTWASEKGNIKFLPYSEYLNNIQEVGKYKIFKLNNEHFIYTYNEYAFNELAGLNIEHFNNVINRTRPENEQSACLYDRAVKTLKKIKSLK